MASSKTSSVRRITARTRDASRAIARSTPQQSRFTQNRLLAWFLRLAGGSLAITALVALFVLPVRDYFQQNDTLSRKVAELEALADANEQLQNEVNDLATVEGTRNAARSQLGYVLPGEQRISLTPMPALPTTLPDVWPYSMITDIVELRAQVVSSTRNPLAPLGP